MKKIIFIVTLFVFFSCKGNKEENYKDSLDTFTVSITKHSDTTNAIVNPIKDSFRYSFIDSIGYSIQTLKDSILKLNKRIKYADYRSGRIVTKIQYYVDITNSRPVNKKYFSDGFKGH